MAWKVIKHREYGRDRHDVLIRSKDFGGHPIRLTIEVDVKECCEKWRDSTLTATIHQTSIIGMASIRSWGPTTPKHCPECGEKL